MAVTGKGAFPLRSTWGRGRGRGRGTDLLRTPIFTSSEETARAVIWSDWFFQSSPVGSTGQIKWYNGSTWVAKPMKVWNGASWVVKPVKYYNGSTWVVTPY